MAPNHKYVAMRRINLVDHESDLEDLASAVKTTTKPTTTTFKLITRKLPVSLYGNCDNDNDCAGPGTLCLSGFCQCRGNFHPKDGYCRE